LLYEQTPSALDNPKEERQRKTLGRQTTRTNRKNEISVGFISGEDTIHPYLRHSQDFIMGDLNSHFAFEVFHLPALQIGKPKGKARENKRERESRPDLKESTQLLG